MHDAPATARHWADEAADAIEAAGRPPVLATGISPSGEIHIGNLREVMTADAVFRVLRERRRDPRLIYICDDLDPLRRVYPFLDSAVYEPLVGRPLSAIPCPCGGHVSYSEHFLAPFLASLCELRIDVEVERAHLLYASGRMNRVIAAALLGRDRIAAILAELTGREVGPDWSPFSPICPVCGRIDRARVTGFDARAQTVSFLCPCGGSGDLPFAGGGKLTWRVDWPARWAVLGVTVEPFGKDHATRGGSYDTGVRIAREVFGIEPPLPIPYEWISLKGLGDMSSSKGNVLSIARALEMVPPEALRYLIVRERPQRSISLDPGLPLLGLVDQIDDAEASGRDERAIDLSRAGGFQPVGVPFKHLIVAAQAANFEIDEVLRVLERTGYAGLTRDAVAARLGYARRWLDEYAPEDLKFRVSPELPAETSRLGDEQKEFLRRLADRLHPGMDGEAVHAQVYELASEFPGVRPAALFEAIYLALLGKPRGPRAGWFVSLLGPEFCARRFREASGGGRA